MSAASKQVVDSLQAKEQLLQSINLEGIIVKKKQNHMKVAFANREWSKND